MLPLQYHHKDAEQEGQHYAGSDLRNHPVSESEKRIKDETGEQNKGYGESKPEPILRFSGFVNIKTVMKEVSGDLLCNKCKEDKACCRPCATKRLAAYRNEPQDIVNIYDHGKLIQKAVDIPYDGNDHRGCRMQRTIQHLVVNQIRNGRHKDTGYAIPKLSVLNIPVYKGSKKKNEDQKTQGQNRYIPDRKIVRKYFGCRCHSLAVLLLPYSNTISKC